MHYLKLRGHPGGWDVIYYFFAFLRGVMMFVVIALIGTGWTFVKPFLSDKDKRIFLIVIPLQILDNIAMVIIEETTPGTQGWFTWKDIFRLVDIICCGAILVPIIWSIKHLKEASQIDGKAARNMHKLKLFRQFYLLVVSYIYFTRIIVYLLDATLPFRWVWLGDLFTEMATFAFYCTTGYKFRPVPDNPFFTLDDDDEKPQQHSHSEKSRQEA
jgi:NADH:ubiquinone oxidoreductase subunit 3 (subunit A)